VPSFGFQYVINQADLASEIHGRLCILEAAFSNSDSKFQQFKRYMTDIFKMIASVAPKDCDTKHSVSYFNFFSLFYLLAARSTFLLCIA